MGLEPINPRHLYRNRIDILKRLGKWVNPYAGRPDPEKYVQLPHGQLIKKSTLREKRIFVNGQRVTEDGTS